MWFGCSKEPSHWYVLLSTHNICFGWEIQKIISVAHSYLGAWMYLWFGVMLNICLKFYSASSPPPRHDWICCGYSNGLRKKALLALLGQCTITNTGSFIYCFNMGWLLFFPFPTLLLSLYLSVCLSICLSVCLSIYVSVCLSDFKCVCLYVFMYYVYIYMLTLLS